MNDISIKSGQNIPLDNGFGNVTAGGTAQTSAVPASAGALPADIDPADLQKTAETGAGIELRKCAASLLKSESSLSLPFIAAVSFTIGGEIDERMEGVSKSFATLSGLYTLGVKLLKDADPGVNQLGKTVDPQGPWLQNGKEPAE